MSELEGAVDAAAVPRTAAEDAGQGGAAGWLWGDWRSWLERRAAAVEAAYRQTTVAERDCILAYRLRQLSEEGEGPIVAVVGANHVPGIVSAWDRAGTAEFRRRCQAFLAPPAAANRTEHAWKATAIDGAAWALEGAAVVGGVWGGAVAVQRLLPRCPRAAAVTVAAAVGGVAAGANAWWEMRTRPAQLVENLARYNDALGAQAGL